MSVTPASAGWRYISFSAYELAAGEIVDLSDNSNELCVVVLSGIVSAETEGHSWKELGGRMSVFDDAAPYAVYIPPRARLTIAAKTAAELGVAGGPAGELPARLIEPAAMRRSERGKGSNMRYVCDILPKMSLPSPSSSSKSRHQVGTLRAILRISTTSIIFLRKVCWRRRVIIESIRRRVLSFSASTATRAILTSRYRWRIAMSFWCLAATIPSSFPTVTNHTTLTSWQVPSASGISTTTQPTNGLSPPVDASLNPN